MVALNVVMTGTLDPALFDWVAFVVIPIAVGVVSLVTAVTAIVIARGADTHAKESEGRARAADEREARWNWANAFMEYVKTPSLASAETSIRWAAMLEDPAVGQIPGWFQDQKRKLEGQLEAVHVAAEYRVFEWVRTGKFNDKDIMNEDGSSMSLV